MAGYESEGRPLGHKTEYIAQRKARRSLAGRLREDYSDEKISYWLGEVLAGRDPDAPREPDGSIKAGASFTVPDWNMRMRAMHMLLNRRNGLPAQHIQIEQEIKAVMAVVHATVPQSVIARIDPVKLGEVRTTLRELIAGRSTPALPAPEPIQDAEYVDVQSDVQASCTPDEHPTAEGRTEE